MNTDESLPDLNRRDFLKGGSLTTMMMLMGGVAIDLRPAARAAEAEAPKKPASPPVKCGLIGCGAWGRDVLATLARLPNAPVTALCDTYEPYLRRAKGSAPQAESFSDYKALLASREVQAVIVATPTHQHKEIVLAALQAGKHVYCEAPLAHTVEDARAIALAAKAAGRVNFQSGLQTRSDPQRHFLLAFVRSGALGNPVKVRGQWHKKQSWRRTSPSAEQVDGGSWFLNRQPVAVTGFGGLMQWKDNRDVPDAVQAVFEYPGGVTLNYECTLANSFDAEYDVYYGTDSAIMLRDGRAWMFKEADSPLLGWEVYARKDVFYKETGIALVADATKLAAQGDAGPADAAAPEYPPLYHALEAFVTNCYTHQAAVEDFVSGFGDADPKALAEYVAGVGKDKMPAAGYQEGFEATVTALKANEAILGAKRIVFQPEWFKLG
jgi:predicted dehydrogenase